MGSSRSDSDMLCYGSILRWVPLYNREIQRIFGECDCLFLSPFHEGSKSGSSDIADVVMNVGPDAKDS